MSGCVVQWCCGWDGRPVEWSRGLGTGYSPGRLGVEGSLGKMGEGFPFRIRSSVGGGMELCLLARA